MYKWVVFFNLAIFHTADLLIMIFIFMSESFDWFFSVEVNKMRVLSLSAVINVMQLFVDI